MIMTTCRIHPLFTLLRNDEEMEGQIKIGSDKVHKIPKTIYGNFFEHLGYAVFGGIWAQILANPTFYGDHNLSNENINTLLTNGQWLTRFFLEGGVPKELPQYWSPGIGATGFGVAILDNATSEGMPLPWKALGDRQSVMPAAGRIGHGLRLHPQGGIVGVGQGVFLPTHRVNQFEVNIWCRIDGGAYPGTLSARFQRRIGGTEILTTTELMNVTCDWQKHTAVLELDAGAINDFEPVDFYLVWNGEADLLVDRVELFPIDHVSGFDRDVLEALKAWKIPLLRGPGGNFVSDYHWRDGVGPSDLRPTRPNFVWGGLEYNAIGTDEFMKICELIGASPQLCINIGTGTPEEAADWVEYCNGGSNTAMGRYRAKNGITSPYDVKLWEVGNEIYGCWQAGNCGSEENARRYLEFSTAMKAIDSSITLIATGNPFDFVEPGPYWSFVTADGLWHEKLIAAAHGALDFVSLHVLPENERGMEKVTHEDAHYALMAHPVHWERTDIPALMELLRKYNSEALLAITEWGVLGTSNMRPRVDNFGEVVFAGLFLNFLARNAPITPIANATAILHGGCVRKSAERVHFDAQYWAILLHQEIAGYWILPCEYRGPGYDIRNGTETSPNVDNVPLIDIVACVNEGGDRLIVMAVNRSLSASIPVNVSLPDIQKYTQAQGKVIASSDPVAVSCPTEPEKFRPINHSVSLDGLQLHVELPPCSLVQIQLS